MKVSSLHRLKHASTPLEIRHTIRRARAYPDTSSILYQLFWPFPGYFTLPKPLSYQELQASPEVINTRQSGIRTLFEIPLFRARDTPLRFLYRLHGDLCADRLTFMSNECEYIFRRGSKYWLLSQIPDPRRRRRLGKRVVRQVRLLDRRHSCAQLWGLSGIEIVQRSE